MTGSMAGYTAHTCASGAGNGERTDVPFLAQMQHSLRGHAKAERCLRTFRGACLVV